MTAEEGKHARSGAAPREHSRGLRTVGEILRDVARRSAHAWLPEVLRRSGTPRERVEDETADETSPGSRRDA